MIGLAADGPCKPMSFRLLGCTLVSGDNLINVNLEIYFPNDNQAPNRQSHLALTRSRRRVVEHR